MKIYWELREKQNPWNGTAKEYRGRERALRNYYDIVRVRDEDELLQAMRRDVICPSDIVLREYLRAPFSNRVTRQGARVFYRAHHFETLHRIENLVCMLKVFWFLRVFNPIRLLREVRSLILCFFNELACIRTATSVLSVSETDAILMNRFYCTNKVVHAPYTTVYWGSELAQLEMVTEPVDVTFFGAMDAASNVHLNYILFFQFIWRRGLRYSITGSHLNTVYSKSVRAHKIQKYHNSESIQQNWTSALQSANMIFIGRLDGRGVKTKIYDCIYLGKPFIIYAGHLQRLTYYGFRFRYEHFSDDFVLILSSDKFSTIMEDLLDRTRRAFSD